MRLINIGRILNCHKISIVSIRIKYNSFLLGRLGSSNVSDSRGFTQYQSVNDT